MKAWSTHLHTTIGLAAAFWFGWQRLAESAHAPKRRDERGLSQSTENAILLAGAVSIATVVVVLITAYVRRNLPK